MTDRVGTEPSPIGTVLGARYELRTLVGRGGMGVVYEGVDRQLDRPVAVKVMRPELAADGRFVSRFRREARTAARLSHPGIVAVHDFGSDGERCFIVMELVAGRTIGTIVREEGPMDQGRAAAIVGSAALALGHAHDRGVVHRDITPGNVMVTPDDGVKVLDFGIARAARSSPRSGSPPAHATITYAAPELARGETADQRADIYALGGILYELLTGRPPFAEGSSAELIRRVTAEMPVPVRDLRPGTSRALEAVVMRCLAKDPAARFDRADELASALRDAAPHPRGRGRDDPATAATQPVPLAQPPGTSSVTAVLPRRLSGARRGGRLRHVGRLALAAACASIVLGGAWIGLSAVSTAESGGSRRRATEPVPLPTGLTVQTSCDGWFATKADLVWTPGGRSDGYEIWRLQPGDQRYSLLTRIDDWRTTSYRDADVGIDTSYRYVVRAVIGTTRSAPNGDVLAKTPLLCLG
jgi:protein kinase-like protein